MQPFRERTARRRVRLPGHARLPGARRRRSATAILFAVLFVTAVGLSVLTGNLPRIFLLGYLALSLFTFIIYALDKWAAQKGAWRTAERTLLLLGLAGGWPGAVIAQQALRHKTRKTSFRAAFWITVLMNCAVLAWLHTGDGKVVALSLSRGGIPIAGH